MSQIRPHNPSSISIHWYFAASLHVLPANIAMNSQQNELSIRRRVLERDATTKVHYTWCIVTRWQR